MIIGQKLSQKCKTKKWDLQMKKLTYVSEKQEKWIQFSV